MCFKLWKQINITLVLRWPFSSLYFSFSIIKTRFCYVDVMMICPNFKWSRGIYQIYNSNTFGRFMANIQAFIDSRIPFLVGGWVLKFCCIFIILILFSLNTTCVEKIKWCKIKKILKLQIMYIINNQNHYNKNKSLLYLKMLNVRWLHIHGVL